ncbi:MAG: hypothetical protein J6866_07585 [Victivallales bacterium]|nr:hypothetical protein [Victivallales bacterium]
MQLTCAEADGTSFTGNSGGQSLAALPPMARFPTGTNGGEPSPGHDGADGAAPSHGGGNLSSGREWRPWQRIILVVSSVMLLEEG